MIALHQSDRRYLRTYTCHVIIYIYMVDCFAKSSKQCFSCIQDFKIIFLQVMSELYTVKYYQFINYQVTSNMFCN